MSVQMQFIGKWAMRFAPLLLVIALVAVFLLMPETAWAGSDTAGDTDGEEFIGIYDWLKGAIQGTLGKLLALAIIAVGIGVGVVRQSIMAFVIGIGAAIGLYNVPNIIDAIMTATFPL